MSTAEPSSFLLFIVFVVCFFSCNPWLIKLSTPMSKRYSDHIHLLNPLPFVFLHFCQWRQKVHSPLTNTAFFSNCSGLLRCIKHGPANSQQFSPLSAMCAHALASENMDLQVDGCMDQTRLRYEIKTKTKKIILEIVKIQRSLYAHFNFTNLRINMDVLSPMHIYIYVYVQGVHQHTLRPTSALLTWRQSHATPPPPITRRNVRRKTGPPSPSSAWPRHSAPAPHAWS